MTQDPAAVPLPDHDRLRADCHALRAEVVRMGWIHWLIRSVVALVLVGLFWRLAQAIVQFGGTIAYDRLGSPDAALVSMLTRINPYIWWVAVAILGLIGLAILRSLWAYGVARERGTVVSAVALQQLGPQLSLAAREVLAWVWQDRAQPLTQGDLRRTLAEIRGGRVAMMHAARHQAAILGLPAAPVATLPDSGGMG